MNFAEKAREIADRIYERNMDSSLEEDVRAIEAALKEAYIQGTLCKENEAKLHIACEALEFYCGKPSWAVYTETTDRPMDDGSVAEAALAKIKGE